MSSVGNHLALVCLLVLLRVLLRNQKFAFVAFVLVAVLNPAGWITNDIWSFAMDILAWSTGLFILMRFALVAVVTATFIAMVFTHLPITMDASAWYSSYGYGALMVIAAMVLYAFRYSLGGRPLLSSSRLDD